MTGTQEAMREEFEAWFKMHQKATWTPLSGDSPEPPEMWGAGLKGYYFTGWQAATAQSAEKIARLEAERKWQPIETAPEDGTIVDLIIDGERITDCYWGLPNHSCGEQGRYCDSDWHSLSDYWVCSIFNEQLGEGATHWMPLPPAPEKE